MRVGTAVTSLLPWHTEAGQGHIGEILPRQGGPESRKRRAAASPAGRLAPASHGKYKDSSRHQKTVTHEWRYCDPMSPAQRAWVQDMLVRLRGGAFDVRSNLGHRLPKQSKLLYSAWALNGLVHSLPANLRA